MQDICGRIHSSECACKCTLFPSVKEFHRKSTWKSEFEVTKNLLFGGSFSELAGPPAGTVRERDGVTGGRGGERGRRTCCELELPATTLTPAPLSFQWCASYPSSSSIFTRNLKLELKLRRPIVRGSFCRSPLNTDSHHPAQQSAHVTAI